MSSRALSPSDATDPDEDEEHVRCMRLRQQQLWALRPVWSVKLIIMMYLILGAIFIPIGVAILVQSFRMVETPRVRYDNLQGCNLGTDRLGNGGTCSVRINVEKDIKAPSYFYYGLVNFYQNHRNYFDSRSQLQLRGEISNSDLENCEPAQFAENNMSQLVPCGLTALSFFNDTLELCSDAQCQNRVTWTKNGIAWDIDKNERFVGSPDFENFQQERIQDEDFMVWMRIATYGNFHKLYRIIQQDLLAGTYIVNINANFPVGIFGGEKFFFISETRWFGGRNKFLGYAYIIVGGICLIFSFVFFVRNNMMSKRQQDDLPLNGSGVGVHMNRSVRQDSIS